MKFSRLEWEKREFFYLNRVFPVLCCGSGPGVVVMHELFGVRERVLDLAECIVERGYTVWVPVLFGPSDRIAGKLEGAAAFAAAWCIRRELHIFSEDKSSPAADLIRALCRSLAQDTGGSVGAVGLCLTGNFAIAAVAEPCVEAAVAGEPSLPIGVLFKRQRCALHLSETEIRTVQHRAENGFEIIGLRFEKDWICPPERFHTLRKKLGDCFLDRGIPGSAHSVLTEDLVDDPEHPTQQALQEVLDYLDKRLKQPKQA